MEQTPERKHGRRPFSGESGEKACISAPRFLILKLERLGPRRTRGHDRGLHNTRQVSVMTSRAKTVIGVVVGVLVVIQLVPMGTKRNPPESAPADLPPKVAAILDRSCFDCHSHRTRWPWYSRVAPSSWLLSHHVGEGREELNFSTWGDLSPTDKTRALESIREVIEDREMPPRSYLWIHRDARLTQEDQAVLRGWLDSLAVEPERADDD